ncbi:MAG: copper homeostasis protein CutC [Pyrinomonadaceae bacterium]
MNDSDSKKRPVLEVIACTVDDAIEAEKGGADRLEIISDFDAGGYTPNLDLVGEIRARVSIPLRVMLREEPGHGLTEIITVERLCCMTCELNSMGVDGVVIGFLTRGRIDIRLTKKILACAPDLKATFHHAFEDSVDKLAAIEDLKLIGQVDKILSHGGFENWQGRVASLTKYAKAAEPEISILAGGRVDRHMIDVIKANSDIREFHVGTSARENGQVAASRVEVLAAAVHRVYA